jgi:hypothetical protein
VLSRKMSSVSFKVSNVVPRGEKEFYIPHSMSLSRRVGKCEAMSDPDRKGSFM